MSQMVTDVFNSLGTSTKLVFTELWKVPIEIAPSRLGERKNIDISNRDAFLVQTKSNRRFRHTTWGVLHPNKALLLGSRDQLAIPQ